MFPLLQLNVSNLPIFTERFQDLELISVFVTSSLSLNQENLASNFAIRTYTKTDNLVRTNLSNPNSPITPFPLRGCLVSDDCPQWDSDDISINLREAIMDLEYANEISYFDEATLYNQTKLFGYPTYIQGSGEFPDGFEFVF